MTSTETPDVYWKLRPQGPTPTDEVCTCAGSLPIVLVDRLSALPIACMSCRGEVPPEAVGFPQQVADELASWRDVQRALLTLWLDSGVYEAWATEQLKDKNGAVNIRGRGIVEQLNKHRRTYYYWFQD